MNFITPTTNNIRNAAITSNNHHLDHNHHTNNITALLINTIGGAGGGGAAATSPTITAASLKTMEWTNDDALELIEQYRSHTELWNRADPKYKDKLCRFRAWSEIAERFGCSKAEVERKMNVLLTQYRREKHKMLLKLYQGIQPNPSKWYAFKRFDFMEAGGGSGSLGAGGGVGGASTNGHIVSALNGLSSAVAAGYEPTSPAAAAAATAAPSTSHHRRLKSKEMKYFGAMGLNLPMLMDTWNTVGHYSPPIGSEHSQLRVPLPLPFSAATTSSLKEASSLFDATSNANLTASPQKPMETSDIEERDEPKHERATTPSNTRDGTLSAGSGGGGVAAAGSGGGGGGASRSSTGIALGSGSNGCGGVAGISHCTESGSSPIPNTNLQEAHKARHEQDDLDIKQELVDYFHAPHPPVLPDSQRSYSSTDENRLGGGGGPGSGGDSDDYAQDLRVSAAAAAAKRLDFSHFVLPRNLRQSTESIDEKFTPLNMRKLNAANAAANAATAAGQMLMTSLLSNESMSEDTSASGRLLKSAGGVSQDASTSAAAAAAALYAESLNRDDCDFIGSNVTLKLRSMDRTQRIIAEKLISEVLFYGQFNELERSARIQPK